MRLYTFEVGTAGENDDVLLGAEWRGGLIDLSAAHAMLLGSRGKVAAQPLSGYISDLLAMGAPGMRAARDALDYVARLPQKDREGLWYSFDEVELWPPLPDPGKVLCCDVNYLRNLEEAASTVAPKSPDFFAKLPNTIIGPGEPIIHPRLTQQLDYAVELAVVIGQQMKNISEADALSGVAGYTILNDVSAHDVRVKDHRITLATNFDTFSPIGPCIVTADEMPDPTNLRLQTLLNGVVVQDASTRDWIFPLPRLLADLSRVMTLEPGDIVTTGTPAGSGAFHSPPAFMKPGDTVALEIEGIGTLENPVVAEP